MNEAFSIEEIDSEIVELLPDREELVLNFANGNVGNQAGLQVTRSIGVGSVQADIFGG